MNSNVCHWLISRRADLVLLLAPAWLALAVAVVLPPGLSLPPWGWLIFVLLVDVAHVYASLWRTYARPGEVRRRPGLYLVMPGVVWCGLVCLAAVIPELFWTVLAYVAVFHFVRQQWGVAALYRMRAGLSGRDLGARLEKAAHYAVTIWPVVWWHAHLPRPFSWFTDTDFVRGLPEEVAWGLLPVAVGAVCLHVGHRWKEGVQSPGRDLWLLTTAAVWGVGIWGVQSDAAFTLPNVVHHGVPYFVLVWWTGHRSHGQGRRTALSGRPFRRSGLALFLLPLFGLAFLEEWGWDRLMWFEHPSLFGSVSFELGPSAVALVLGTLSLPQVTHYILDGFIWRMDGSNPGLREAWSGEPPVHGSASEEDFPPPVAGRG